MKASGFVLAWVAVQARGQGAPSAAVCLLSESAREGSQPSSSPSALRTSRSMIWVATSEPTRCVFAMLGFAMCTSGCTASISQHTHSTCVLSHCVFGMLGVHGCAVAILDVHSCVLVIFERTRCVLAMLGLHGCVIAMCASSCTKAISVYSQCLS